MISEVHLKFSCLFFPISTGPSPLRCQTTTTTTTTTTNQCLWPSIPNSHGDLGRMLLSPALSGRVLVKASTTESSWELLEEGCCGGLSTKGGGGGVDKGWGEVAHSVWLRDLTT